MKGNSWQVSNNKHGDRGEKVRQEAHMPYIKQELAGKIGKNNQQSPDWWALYQ